MKKPKQPILQSERLDWNKVALISHLFEGEGVTYLHSLFILALVIERMSGGTLLSYAQEHLHRCQNEGRTEQYALDTLRAFIMKKQK